jgi:aspartate aminotransferase
MTGLPPLPAAIAGAAAPQDRFERLRERTLLRKAPHVADLAYANAQDGPAPDVVAAIRGALETTRALDLQYTPYGGATITRRLVAQRLPAVGGRRSSWRQVVMTPGAMAALNVLFRAVRREGAHDQAVVVTPCWLDHPLYLANLGFEPRLVPVDPVTLRLDVPAIVRALTADTRVVVLAQPANPTGVVHGQDELRALGEALAAAPAPPLLVSDECHREIIHPGGGPFVSPADHYPATCSVYSFGKSWFMQGQRVGYAAVSPAMPGADAFAERLVTWCRVMGFCTPTALMQLAVRALVGRQPDFAAITRRRGRAIERLQAAGYALVPSEATFFLYPRVPWNMDDFAFTELLADEGVLVLPASMFHHRGHVRLSLTARDQEVDRALSVMEAVIAGGAPS